MGASWFSQTAYGKTLRDAYNTAVQDAEDYAGHQEGYNGTISTTHILNDLTQDYKRSKKDLDKFINDQADRLNKRECAAICIQEPKANSNKTQSKVDHIVTSGTKKWVLRYVVYNHEDYMIASCDTKGEAVKKAREYTEKRQTATKVCMEKTLERGNSTVARITYKKSTTERPGKWVLFGWAAE